MQLHEGVSDIATNYSSHMKWQDSQHVTGMIMITFEHICYSHLSKVNKMCLTSCLHCVDAS